MIPGNNPNNERFPGHETTSVDTKAPAHWAFSSGWRRRLLIGGAIFLLASVAAGALLAAKILAPFKQVAVREGRGDAHKAQIVIREQYNALQIIPQVAPSGRPPVGTTTASAQPAPMSGAQVAIPHPVASSPGDASKPQLAAAPGRLQAVPQPAAPQASVAPLEVTKTAGKVSGMPATRQPPAPDRGAARFAATRPAQPPVAPARSARQLPPPARQAPARALAQHRASASHQPLRLASIPVLPLDRPASQAYRVIVPSRKIAPQPAASVAPRPAQAIAPRLAHTATPHLAHAAAPSHHVQPAAPHATVVARATPGVQLNPATADTGILKHPVKREEGNASPHPADHTTRKAGASRQAHAQTQHIRPVRPVLADRGDDELPRHRRYADRLPADAGDEMDDDGPPPGYYAPPPRYYAPPPRYYGPPAYPGYMYRPPPPYYPGW